MEHGIFFISLSAVLCISIQPPSVSPLPYNHVKTKKKMGFNALLGILLWYLFRGNKSILFLLGSSGVTGYPGLL